MSDADSPERAAEVLGELERMEGLRCAGCPADLCGHDALMSIVSGYKSEPRCPRCLASALGRELEAMKSHLAEYIRHRACFKAGWEWADRREGPHDDAWDAGEMGCGDLVLQLRIRLGALAPGRVLRVTARDPGAPEDIPAWCGLTGHGLVAARHPVYFIRRKEG